MLCKSSTAQDMCQPFPVLISCVGVTGRWRLWSCAQNAVTLYVAGLIQNVSRSSSKASSLYGAVYCSTIVVIVIVICYRCICTNVCMYTVNAGSEPYLTAENTRAVMCLRGSSKFVGLASISFRFSIY